MTVTVTLSNGQTEHFADARVRDRGERWAHAYRYEVDRLTDALVVWRRDVWQDNLGWNESRDSVEQEVGYFRQDKWEHVRGD